MANFPTNPNPGDVHTDVSGNTYEFQASGVWKKTVLDDVVSKQTIQANIVTVADATARKNPATYADAQVGFTRVIQSDLEGILWALIAADVSLDASWIGQPYTVDPDGSVVVSMEVVNTTGTIPDKNVISESGGVISIGDGITENGRKVMMNEKPAGMVRMVSVKASGNVSLNLRSSTGYMSIRWWDGSVSLVGTGVVSSSWGVNKACPTTGNWSDSSPKEIYAWSCDSAGVQSGDLLYLGCYNNNLTTLDVSGLTALTQLYGYYNNLTTLDVSGLTALTQLYCQDNTLTTLDVSGLTALSALGCQNNTLTTLDVSGLTALVDLDCYNNNLISLDVSGLTAMYYLSCGFQSGGMLTTSGNTALQSITATFDNDTFVMVGDLPYADYGGYSGYTDINLSGEAWLDTDALYDLLVGVTIPDGGLDAGLLAITGCPCLGGGASIVDGVTHTAAEVEALITAKKLYY